MDHSTTGIAGQEVVMETARTDRLALVVVDVLVPDTLTAVLTDYGVLLETGVTEILVLEQV